MSRKAIRKAIFSNMFSDDVYYNYYKNLYLNKFKYNGLPDGISTELIENALFHRRKVGIFKFEQEGFLVLPFSPTGSLNPYSDFTMGQPICYSWSLPVARKQLEYLQPLDEINNTFVEIYDNKGKITPCEMLHYYAKRISDIMRAIEVKIQQSKIDVLMETTEETKKTLEIALSEIEHNIVNIFVRKDIKDLMQDVKVHDLTSSIDKISKLFDALNNTQSELLKFIGIDTISNDKKERLTYKESTIDSILVKESNDYRLDCRRKFISNFNRCYGFNATVELNRLDSALDYGEVKENAI